MGMASRERNPRTIAGAREAVEVPKVLMSGAAARRTEATPGRALAGGGQSNGVVFDGSG